MNSIQTVTMVSSLNYSLSKLNIYDKDSQYYDDVNYIDNECEEMIKLFPMAKFTVSIPMYKMDNLLTMKDVVIIRQKFDCHCWRGRRNKKDKDFIIRGTSGTITIKHVINKLINQKFKLTCNHHFLERFFKIGIDHGIEVFGMSMGS